METGVYVTGSWWECWGDLTPPLPRCDRVAPLSSFKDQFILSEVDSTTARSMPGAFCPWAAVSGSCFEGAVRGSPVKFLGLKGRDSRRLHCLFVKT